MNNQQVSFDDEMLILVDEDDQVVGYKDKQACHDNEGVLHRAFSIFIFNEKGQVLLQQRGRDKRLWPGFWSNSCCSHPRKGESMETATQRRLKEELGFITDLQYLYYFEYQATFENKGTEHELCHVYIGRYDDKVTINPTEIEDWQWIDWQDLKDEVENNPDRFTPWFKQELTVLRDQYSAEIEAIIN